MASPGPGKKPMARRVFLKHVGRGLSLCAIGGAAGVFGLRTARAGTLWQIDPLKCTQCGQCATYCVLGVSAVKCVHQYAMCGYCKLCTGFFEPEPNRLDTGAENQLCPTGALKRAFVEDPYHQYDIDEALCIGCGKCVKGCATFGNGSLYLQVRHDRCLNCNQCNIAAHCPSKAFSRVPPAPGYLRK